MITHMPKEDIGTRARTIHTNLCKKFKITSLVSETANEVDPMPACTITSSQDLVMSDTLPLLMREERDD